MASNCSGKAAALKMRRCIETRDEGESRCRRKRLESRTECEREEKVEREKCLREEQQRRKECANWSRWSRWLCLGWNWVVSTVCTVKRVITDWVCVAWTEVTHSVCVFAVWVSDIVCVAWENITAVICTLIDVVSAVVGGLISLVESTLGIITDIIATFLELLASIPVIGRLADFLHKIFAEIIGRFISIFAEGFLWALGIQPEKKMRVCVIMPSQLATLNGPLPALPPAQVGLGTPTVTNMEAVVAQLQEAIRIFRRECNIRLVPVAGQPSSLFSFRTPFSTESVADESWISRISIADEAIDGIRCNEAGQIDNLLLSGTRNKIASSHCWRGATRGLVGIGAPVKVIIVRSHDNGLGCSLGIATDYVTVNAATGTNGGPSNLDTIAHETGHACGLYHREGAKERDNLMTPGPRRQGQKLTNWQAFVIRTSRHVSYF